VRLESNERVDLSVPREGRRQSGFAARRRRQAGLLVGPQLQDGALQTRARGETQSRLSADEEKLTFMRIF